MSTTPIIIETQANLAGLISTKQGLQELEPATAAATKGFERVKESAQEFASAEEYVNRMNTRMKAAFDENIAGSTEMGYSVREARGAARMLADELGIHLNRELSGTLARSEVLGPMLEKAFTALAIAGFVQVAAEAVKTMAEWDDIVIKDAEKQDEFNRSLLHSNDALNQAKEHVAALYGPLAEAAQKSADYGSKSVDLTQEMKYLNGALEAAPGLWKSFEEAIGGVIVKSGIVLGVINPVLRDLERFNEDLADSVNQNNDLGPAIAKVTSELQTLQGVYHQMTTGNPLKVFYFEITGQADQLASYIDSYKKTQNQLITDKKTADIERLTEQQQAEETLAADRARADEAQIGYEEAQAKELIKLHQATYEQELQMLLSYEDKKYAAQVSAVTAKRASLAAMEKANPGTDYSAAEKALQVELDELYAKHEKARLDLVTANDEEITKRDQSLATARIDAEYKVADANDKLEEAMAKRMMAKAQDVTHVLAAQKAELDAINKSYDDQFDKVMNLARVQETELPGPMKSTLGTQGYGQELQQYDKLAPEAVAKLTDLNSQMISLTAQRTEAINGLLAESADRQEAIGKQVLDDVLAQLNAEVQQTKTSYGEQAEALKALYQQKAITGSQYLAEQKALYQQEYNDVVASYEQEASAVRDAAARKVITEQEASKKLHQIYAQESKAFQEFQNQNANALAQNVQRMEENIQKFFQTFNQGLTRMMTTNESFLKMMTGVWNNLVTSFANMVLKMVEQWAAGELIKLTLSKTAADEQTANAVAHDAIEKLSAAKKAAVKAGASVGYPLDLVVAPLVFAAMMAFEQGGIVPGSKGSAVPIMAHAREMVLPEHISTFVQDAAAAHGGLGGSSAVSQSNTVHNHNNFELHVHGGQTDKDDVISWVNEGIKAGSVSYR